MPNISQVKKEIKEGVGRTIAEMMREARAAYDRDARSEFQTQMNFNTHTDPGDENKEESMDAAIMIVLDGPTQYLMWAYEMVDDEPLSMIEMYPQRFQVLEVRLRRPCGHLECAIPVRMNLN